eukprot:6183608-Pleurochrysis_carterae.AAC.7
MDEARRGALRLLANVRGRFEGLRGEAKTYKDMCDVAQKALAVNVAELKASARKAEGDTRKAAQDARGAAFALQDSLDTALSDLDAARKESESQQAIASDAIERLNTANAALDRLEKSEVDGAKLRRVADYR